MMAMLMAMLMANKERVRAYRLIKVVRLTEAAIMY